MVYKVVRAEDEPIIRCGIASCIPWQEAGFELAGTASNGREALQICAREHIDVIISDIRMPVMDGLELVREAKKINPGVKAVMVSSYSEFQYAQEAVKTGVVVDYLLKPTMDPEDLVEVLKRCKERLDEEKASRERSAFFESERRRHELEQAEIRLKKCLLGGAEPPAPVRPWMKEPLVLSVWTFAPPAMLAEDVKAMLAEGGDPPLAAVLGENELAALYPDRGGAAFSDITKRWSDLVRAADASVTVGVSPAFHDLKTLRDAYQWAKAALEQAFVTGEGGVYRGAIGPRCADAEAAEREWAELQELAVRALDAADLDQFERLLARAVDRWGSRAAGKKEIIGEAQQLLILFHSKMKKLYPDYTARELWEQLRAIEAAPSLPSLAAWFRDLAGRFRQEDRLPVLAEDSFNVHSIQRALEFIREHYLKDLSLQDAADYVNMSRNYFSEQFKRHTGMNFIDNLIHLRIQHAKRLLRTTSLRVYEVGMRSGFNSTKHFLKLFKRKVRCTPAEYRMRHSAAAQESQGAI